MDINEVTIVGTVTSAVTLGRTSREGCEACYFVVETQRGRRFVPSGLKSLSMMARVNCYDDVVCGVQELQPGDRVLVRGELMNRRFAPRTDNTDSMWFTEIKALFVGHVDFSSDDSSKPDDEVKGDTVG